MSIVNDVSINLIIERILRFIKCREGYVRVGSYVVCKSELEDDDRLASYIIKMLMSDRVTKPYEVPLGYTIYCTNCERHTFWRVVYVEDVRVNPNAPPDYAYCTKCKKRVDLTVKLWAQKK